MRSFEWIRSILLGWQHWRIRRRTAQVVAQIDDLDEMIGKAKRHHRGVRDLERRRRDLTTRRLQIELRQW